MADHQLGALLWGVFAIPFGTCFIVFREWISERARLRYEERGIKLTSRTQSPMLMGIAGGILVVAGIAVVIGVLTGAGR